MGAVFTGRDDTMTKVNEDEGDAFEGRESGAVIVQEARAPVGAPTERQVPQAPASPALVRWPKARGAGEVVFQTWGGFGAECPDCGFTFVRPTPEEAREAVTYRQDQHGVRACAEAAARLTDKQREALRKLYETPIAAPKAPKKAKVARGAE
jgi:hypothetical protein